MIVKINRLFNDAEAGWIPRVPAAPHPALQ
jgi:hypothetical protein